MIALLALFVVTANAAPPQDALTTSVSEELARAKTLTLPGTPKPYYVACSAFDGDHIDITAVLGGIVADDHGPERYADIAVRVGSPALDNGNFRSGFNFDTGFLTVPLVLDDDATALRHDLWLGFDQGYKGAVQNLARREASRRGQTGLDPTPSFVPTPAVEASLPPAALPVNDDLVALARSLSARFLSHPDIEASRVLLADGAGRSVLADTSGTLLVRPQAELDLRIVAMARAADGTTATDQASFIVRSAADLPDRAHLEAAADALAGRLEHWRTTPVAKEPYVGPVVFEGEAAVDLFRYLLVPALSSTPPIERPSDDPFASQTEEPSAMSLKRRILPPGYTVVDDPTADPSLPSSYRWDDEGVPAQRVQLVDDGVVRGLLASRIPSHDAPASNGHGRGSMGEEVAAMPSFLVVDPGRASSDAHLAKAALKAARPYDLDYVLVVRRLADPSVAQQASQMVFFGPRSKPAPALPAPIDVVKRYADGHEEPVRGLHWNGMDRRVLRDVLAAGASTTRTYLQPMRGHEDAGATYGLPVTLSAPSVLISEVELDPDTAPKPTLPLLSSPLAGP